jgi:hypothetical protein
MVARPLTNFWLLVALGVSWKTLWQRLCERLEYNKLWAAYYTSLATLKQTVTKTGGPVLALFTGQVNASEPITCEHASGVLAAVYHIREFEHSRYYCCDCLPCVLPSCF